MWWIATRCAAFVDTIKRRRLLAKDRKHTQAEALIGNDRDHGHRDDD